MREFNVHVLVVLNSIQDLDEIRVVVHGIPQGVQHDLPVRHSGQGAPGTADPEPSEATHAVIHPSGRPPHAFVQ